MPAVIAVSQPDGSSEKPGFVELESQDAQDAEQDAVYPASDAEG